MNPELDSLIERFREAQDIGVRTLTEQLQIPQPASNREWPVVCIDHQIDRRCRRKEIDIYTHGFGIELKIEDLTIDFDWGENGEPDGFDAWRLYNYTLDNGGPESFTHDSIQTIIDDALAAGELIKSGTLYFDPKRRAHSKARNTDKCEQNGEPEPPITPVLNSQVSGGGPVTLGVMRTDFPLSADQRCTDLESPRRTRLRARHRKTHHRCLALRARNHP